jgi:glycosyltransferase involved in cell wall biosynthesis
MTPFDAVSRCDLHMHSDASVMNDEWYTKFFGCPESYANPVRQYELCKARGMSLVTLTDHDSIEGGLRLVDHSDFFLSEEVTTRFPENGCVMHVLVWNITEDQHKELQRRRDNIYDLSRYLRSTGLAHGLAHPLLSSNWRLDAVTLEKSLVLFSTLESLNGLVDRRTDPTMAHLLASLTPEVLETLSRKHGIPLPEGGARRPALTAGSDDHVHRRCGTVFTEIDGVLDAPAFLDKVMRGEGRPVGSTADMNRMSACIKHTSYEHFRRECKDGQRVQSPFVDLMDCIAGRPPRITRDTTRTAAALVESLVASAAKIPYVGQPAVDIGQTPDMASAECDERVSSAVVQMSDALLAKTVKNLADSILAFDIYGVLAVLPDLTGALVAAAPMLFAANHFAKQESQIRDVWRDWTAFPAPNPPEHLAVFSDSLDKVDGVATWCGRFGQQASKAGRKVWFASCDSTPPGEAPADENKPRDPESIPLVARFDLPIYPGFELTIPSLAATVEMLWRKRITHVEVSTPGPMGLAGLAAGRLLRLPVTASYHTDLPDLLATLTGEPGLAKLARSYLGWFYRAVDRVFAFSPASRDKLVAMGVPESTITLMPVAVDPADFSPNKSSATAFTSLGVDTRDRPIILSVGRLSEEKNIPLVVEAVESLQERTNPPLLVVVGDGPVRRDLEMRCKDKEFVVFLGFQQGEVLRNLYASASVFVFASRVDTLGLVNLEALASGVPILVPDDSAIAQSLDHGNTAMFFAPNAEDLARTIGLVLDNPDCATRLAEGGRRHTLALWRKADFEHVWTTMVGALGIRTPS